MTLRFLSTELAARWRRLTGRDTLREVVFFLAVGGTGAVLFTALNVLFTNAGLRPGLSIAVSLALLIPPVYYGQHRLTFRSGRNHWSAFPRYVGTQLFGNVIGMVVAEIFAGSVRAHPLVAYVLLSVMIAVLNYGLLKFWAFRHSPAPAG